MSGPRATCAPISPPRGPHERGSDDREPLLEQRRSRPRDDLLSALGTQEVDGERLDDEEVLGFLRRLFPAGVDTTWLTLDSLMYAVLPNLRLVEPPRIAGVVLRGPRELRVEWDAP